MGETDFELADKTEVVERDGSTSPTAPAGPRRFKKDEAILARFGKRQQLRVSAPMLLLLLILLRWLRHTLELPC